MLVNEYDISSFAKIRKSNFEFSSEVISNISGHAITPSLRKEEFESQKRWCEMKLSLEATKEKINGIKKQIDSIRSESKF